MSIDIECSMACISRGKKKHPILGENARQIAQAITKVLLLGVSRQSIETFRIETNEIGKRFFIRGQFVRRLESTASVVLKPSLNKGLFLAFEEFFVNGVF